MSYGLEIKSAANLTLFSTDDVGSGTFVHTSGTIAENTALTTKASDMLLFKLSSAVSSGHAFWVKSETSFSGTGNNVVYTTKFHIDRTAGSSQNITSVDYVIVRSFEFAYINPSLTYGLRTFYPGGAYGTTPIPKFDSRMFRDANPSFDITNTDSTPLQHRGLLKSLDNTTYFSANPLDYTNITNFIREFGIIFSNTTGTAFQGSNFTNRITGTGIRACNRLNQGSGGISYPTSLQPYFWGEFR